MHKLDTHTRRGIAAVNTGDPQRGRELLRQALLENPQNELAWLWMSVVVDDPEQQRACLQRVLEINPENQVARTRLAALPTPASRNGTVPPALPASVGQAGSCEPPPEPLRLAGDEGDVYGDAAPLSAAPDHKESVVSTPASGRATPSGASPTPAVEVSGAQPFDDRTDARPPHGWNINPILLRRAFYLAMLAILCIVLLALMADLL